MELNKLLYTSMLLLFSNIGSAALTLDWVKDDVVIIENGVDVTDYHTLTPRNTPSNGLKGIHELIPEITFFDTWAFSSTADQRLKLGIQTNYHGDFEHPFNIMLTDNKSTSWSGAWNCAAGAVCNAFSMPDTVVTDDILNTVIDVTAGTWYVMVSGATKPYEHGINSASSYEVRINQTPIPAAVWLFGSAILGIGGLASRRKSLTDESIAA